MRLVVAFMSVLLFACQSYNGAALRELAHRNSEREQITQEMCDDFRSASEAAVNGDDKTLPIVGKSKELRTASKGFWKMGLLCDRVVHDIELGNMPPFVHGQVLGRFHDVWDIVKALGN